MQIAMHSHTIEILLIFKMRVNELYNNLVPVINEVIAYFALSNV